MWGGVKRDTQNDTFGKLIGNRLGAAPPGHSRELIKCIIRKHRELARARATSPSPASAPSMIHCSRRWCEDVLQRWSCMLSAPLTPQPRSACPFAHRHGRSNHLHVSVEPHVPHSHDHMVARMWHVSLALSLSNCRLIRRAQPRLTSAIFVCVILAGTSICRTIHRSISMLLDGICR